MNDSNRNALEWLADRFRELVLPKKLVTLKQVKELNLTTTSEKPLKFYVDLFVNNGKESICEVLLMDALSELSRENKFNLKNSQSINLAIESFDCRVIGIEIISKKHLIELKVGFLSKHIKW